MFTGIKRKIILSNMLGLPLIFIALLFIDSERASLTDLQIKGLFQQAKTIASILTERSAGRYDFKHDKLLRPSGRSGLYLREPLLSEHLDALLFDRRGNIIEDSRKHFPGKITVSPLPAIGHSMNEKSRYQILSEKIFYLLHKSNVTNHFFFAENQGAFGADFIEFQDAVMGVPSSVIRINSLEQTILSVAVPVRRLGKVLGVLKLSSSNQNIAMAVQKERDILINLFFVASIISIVMSVILARGIAQPIINLTRYVRFAEKSNFRLNLLKIVDLTHLNQRNDEIGTLSQSFDMLITKLTNHFSDIETFAADVAHELKNPLTSLKSALDIFDYVNDTEKKKQLLNVIKHDIMRIDRLIGDISNLSRIDAEMNREIYHDTDIVLMFRNLIIHYQNGTLSDGIVINLITPCDKIIFSCIADRIGRAFSNIIENALSFTPQGGQIDIILEKKQGKIFITIQDTGIGIPQKSLEHIFNRFYSDRQQENSFGNHSGLGLSIVKRIIEAHRGIITASNRTDGKIGAIFQIIFSE